MRKVETLMCAAVKQRASTTCGSNTRVVSDETGSHVYLHGHKIAKVAANGDVSISNAGWRTNTTKSRLNAIINCFLDGTKNGIYQKDNCWYVTDHGRDYDFDSSGWYSFKSNALDVTYSVTNTELVAV